MGIKNFLEKLFGESEASAQVTKPNEHTLDQVELNLFETNGFSKMPGANVYVKGSIGMQVLGGGDVRVFEIYPSSNPPIRGELDPVFSDNETSVYYPP